MQIINNEVLAQFLRQRIRDKRRHSSRCEISKISKPSDKQRTNKTRARGAYRARFTRLIKNAIDVMFRQMAFNLFRGSKALGVV